MLTAVAPPALAAGSATYIMARPAFAAGSATYIVRLRRGS